MGKKIIVAGCRNYTDYDEAKNFINFCIKDFKDKYSLCLLSGGCRGADLLGERFAIENNWQIKKYPAEWNKYGRAAGPIRNNKMVCDSDFIICFWDGKSKGTENLIKSAIKQGKSIKIKSI